MQAVIASAASLVRLLQPWYPATLKPRAETAGRTTGWFWQVLSVAHRGGPMACGNFAERRWVDDEEARQGEIVRSDGTTERHWGAASCRVSASSAHRGSQHGAGNLPSSFQMTKVAVLNNHRSAPAQHSISTPAEGYVRRHLRISISHWQKKLDQLSHFWSESFQQSTVVVNETTNSTPTRGNKGNTQVSKHNVKLPTRVHRVHFSWHPPRHQHATKAPCYVHPLCPAERASRYLSVAPTISAGACAAIAVAAK